MVAVIVAAFDVRVPGWTRGRVDSGQARTLRPMIEAGRRVPRCPPGFIIPSFTSWRALTGVAAAGLVASYCVTWDLWSARLVPPNLPVVGALSSFGFGAPLIVLAVAAVIFPRSGATGHGALLLLAVLGDQVRLQPEFVSLAILLVAGAWPPKSLAAGRWHLIALWGWAGMHKVLSGGWPSGGALFIARAAGDTRLRPAMAVIVPICELGLAAMALSPRRWRVLRVAAPLFHVGIVTVLVRAHWNSSVWPWNLALGAAALLVFRSPSAEAQHTVDRRSLVARVAAVVFLLYPLGFYTGYSDAYLSHNLYSSNTAEASLCTAEIPERCSPQAFSTWKSLNVLLPPERRLFVAWFDQFCQPGQRLKIDGVWTRLSERRVEHLDCPRPR